MKKLTLVTLFFGAVTMLSSPVQAYDRCYDGYDRRYSNERYEYRDRVRYERPYYRSYYYDERPVVIRREVVVDDCREYPRYRHHHTSGIRFFFGF